MYLSETSNLIPSHFTPHPGKYLPHGCPTVSVWWRNEWRTHVFCGFFITYDINSQLFQSWPLLPFSWPLFTSCLELDIKLYRMKAHTNCVCQFHASYMLSLWSGVAVLLTCFFHNIVSASISAPITSVFSCIPDSCVHLGALGHVVREMIILQACLLFLTAATHNTSRTHSKE